MARGGTRAEGQRASVSEVTERARETDAEAARERLFRLGVAALTDVELLGLLWEPGPRDGGRQEGAAQVLDSGGLKSLAREDAVALSVRPGLGPSRAIQLVVALELARRARRSEEPRPRLCNARQIHAYLEPTLGALRREVFHVLCFNARNVLVHDARVAEGTMNMCPVDPREVFSAALASRATAIVLAHNHPSGDPEPSAQDIALTRQLAAAAGLLGIKLLDHLVVGDTGYVSLMERRLLPGDEDGRRAWGVAGRGS
ncbi:DNA repair protein RadC [Myxococcaceae bacterium JPH2]|nr:DNA repair protein RadC [Myxococcaceae bacterium JPH2]